MTPAARHLFVYGTLMSAAASPMGRSQRARLQREGQSLGPATIQGRLYDLGRYPGLVPSNDASDVVHGEVFALDDPAASLRWLDAYEGLVSGRHDGNDYHRVMRPVRLANRAELAAWVYLYARDCAQARLLPEGRWLDR